MNHDQQSELVALLEANRARCLWFMREGYVPATPEEWLHTLDLIVQHGDMAVFKKVGEIKKWLSPLSKATS